MDMNLSQTLFFAFVFEYLSLMMVFLSYNFQTGFFAICCMKKSIQRPMEIFLVQNYMVPLYHDSSWAVFSLFISLFLISDFC